MNIPFFSFTSLGASKPKKDTSARIVHELPDHEHEYDYEPTDCPGHDLNFHRNAYSPTTSTLNTYVGLYKVYCSHCGISTLAHIEDKYLEYALAQDLIDTVES